MEEASPASTLSPISYEYSNLSDLQDLKGGSGAAMTVVLDKTAMQYIAEHGYQTSNVDTKQINFKKLTNPVTPSQTVTSTPNTPITAPGLSNGASSYTGQTKAAPSGENKNTNEVTTYPQAGGELFGMTYQAFLNKTVQTTTSGGTSVTEASNTAMTSNNGHDSAPTGSVPLKTSGAYNGGDAPQKGETAGTDPIPDGDITGTDNNGTANGIPNKTAVGAGINWVKIDGAGAALPGAEFQVSRTQNGTMQYLYSNGSGWPRL